MARPRLVELDIEERLRGAEGPSEGELRESLKRSQRAVALLTNPEFVAWRRVIEGEKERLKDALVKRTESEQAADIKRGKILAIEQLFAGLEIQAQNLEEAMRRIEEYERTSATEPVDRFDWLRGF